MTVSPRKLIWNYELPKGQMKKLLDIAATHAASTREHFASLKAIKVSKKNSNRNKPCICGSNLKFKKCCWNK